MLTVKYFEFNPVRENTFVLYNEMKECIIIDAGCYDSAEEDTLKRFIESNGLETKFLLNTHAHFDHLYGAAFVHREWGLRPAFHVADQPLFDNAEEASLAWNIPFQNYKGPVSYITPGVPIMLGNDKLDVLFTPGHAPGHVVFYCQAQRFVIGGDVLFKGGVGRTDLPLASHHTLIKSINEQLMTLPDDVVVYPGHGPSTTIGEERRTNPFLN
jgi:hydroxyacylglutathione hydrolase